jgi:predicted ATPase
MAGLKPKMVKRLQQQMKKAANHIGVKIQTHSVYKPYVSGTIK